MLGDFEGVERGSCLEMLIEWEEGHFGRFLGSEWEVFLGDSAGVGQVTYK